MRWLKQLFGRRRQYDEISDLIREHIDEKIADLMDRVWRARRPNKLLAASLGGGGEHNTH